MVAALDNPIQSLGRKKELTGEDCPDFHTKGVECILDKPDLKNKSEKLFAGPEACTSISTALI